MVKRRRREIPGVTLETRTWEKVVKPCLRVDLPGGPVGSDTVSVTDLHTEVSESFSSMVQGWRGYFDRTVVAMKKP